MSGRPYTVFRWKPGPDARYKKTIICQEVAKAKNVCQVCLLDLTYNLPVQVRDQAMGIDPEKELPQSGVGREFALREQEEAGTLGTQFIDAPPNELLQRLQRNTPYYEVRACVWLIAVLDKQRCFMHHRHSSSRRNQHTATPLTAQQGTYMHVLYQGAMHAWC